MIRATGGEAYTCLADVRSRKQEASLMLIEAQAVELIEVAREIVRIMNN